MTASPAGSRRLPRRAVVALLATGSGAIAIVIALAWFGEPVSAGIWKVVGVWLAVAALGQVALAWHAIGARDLPELAGHLLKATGAVVIVLAAWHQGDGPGIAAPGLLFGGLLLSVVVGDTVQWALRRWASSTDR
jgi:hypothetical protein